jgi:hypothetical protein
LPLSLQQLLLLEQFAFFALAFFLPLSSAKDEPLIRNAAVARINIFFIKNNFSF